MTKRTRNGNPAIAIAYIRVSTTDQKLGQGAQRTLISEWARAAGVTTLRGWQRAMPPAAGPLRAATALLRPDW